MFSIQFNNCNSYKDLGLVVEHRPNIPFPQRSVNTISMPGRSGALTEDLGIYEDIKINIVFGFQDKSNINNKCRLIKYWLNNITDKKLMFQDDSNMFYMVKYIQTNDIERGIRNLGKLNVVFICEPFAYLQDESITINKINSTVYNPGTVESQPNIKIYGSGSIALKINNGIIKFKDVNNHIEINSEMMECYKGDTPLNYKMIGEFPRLQVGENKISWEGDVSKIEILPRWRCL